MMKTTLGNQTEIEAKLFGGKCLRCDATMFTAKHKPVADDTDPDTGFPYQHCKRCRDYIKAHPLKPKDNAKKLNDAHRAEGIANLDRLLSGAQ